MPALRMALPTTPCIIEGSPSVYNILNDRVDYWSNARRAPQKKTWTSQRAEDAAIMAM